MAKFAAPVLELSRTARPRVSARFQSAAADVAIIDWDALKNASHSPDEADRSAINAIALAANLIKTGTRQP